MPEIFKLLLCLQDQNDSTWIKETSAELDSELIFVQKENGKQAIWFLNELKIHSRFPCLILLDINMPSNDGRETLKAIKRDPELKEIPVVVLTNSSSKADQLFCELYGADYIAKTDEEEIKNRIERVVSGRRSYAAA